MDIENENKEFARPLNQKKTIELKTDDSFETLGNSPISIMGNPYLLVLINKSDKCFTRIRTKNVNQPNWGQFWALPLTCRTCSLATITDCYNQKKWANLLTTDCNSVAFEVEIATTPDAQGNYFVAQYDAIQPSCTYAGGVLSYE